MTPFEEALDIVENAAWRMPTERIALHDAVARVLAQDLFSDMDMPPFNRSAVDGYACRIADLPGTLRCVQVIAAGTVMHAPLPQGACAKIMTGAPLPLGADCVVMVEQAEVLDMAHVRLEGPPSSSNFVVQGEELRQGDCLLRSGTRMGPAHAALLALAGCVHPEVSALPRVGVFSTGSEIVPPHERPGVGQIRNSNTTQLLALCADIGLRGRDFGTVRDEVFALREHFERAAEECDVVISTGGVSMGDFDLVPEVLESIGFHVRLRRVAIQPGKPIVFAVRGNTAAFALSGNPNSSFLQFELFVKPFLYRLQGAAYRPRNLLLPAAKPFRRKHTERLLFLPVTLNADSQAETVDYRGSAHILAYASADGWMLVPPGTERIAAGAPVRVRLLKAN